MLSTLVIVALQHSRRVFWFSFDHWLSAPWFFSRSRTRLVFSFFFTQKTFFFFLWAMIRDIFISCSWPGFFFVFFLVPWILVDIRLLNIYIYIYIYIYICIYIYILMWHRIRRELTCKYFLIYFVNNRVTRSTSPHARTHIHKHTHIHTNIYQLKNPSICTLQQFLTIMAIVLDNYYKNCSSAR